MGRIDRVFAVIAGALVLGMPTTAASLAAVASPDRAAADTPQSAGSGVRFTLPKDWSLTTNAVGTVLAPPEGDVEIVVVDVADAKDGADAIARAWRSARPKADRKILHTTRTPPSSEWSEGLSVAFETSPNERRAVNALALRSGTRWTVIVLDGATPTLEKRQAALALIYQSLLPPNVARETFAGRTANRLTSERVAALKAFVETSMKELGVPGASIALIDNGKIVFEGGFGLRELGRPELVDAHTLFIVASNTKGMSTLLLAKLVDEGKLAWDEPVTKAYPKFRLGDDATTAQVRIRDLVCACTGLPRKDFEHLFNTPRDTPAQNTFTLLAATAPTTKFGQVYQYNNLIASAAGYVGGHVAFPDREIGAAYDAAMQTLVFDPLGMDDTTFDFSRAMKGNHASPHGVGLDGKPHVASMDLNYEVIPYRPAGGAWSSAHDMIRYVRNELNQGLLPNGKQMVSAENLLMRRAPGVPIGEDAHYGMGLVVSSRHGVNMIQHGGSLVGFKSDWFAIPDAGVGAVILTNANQGGVLANLFGRRLLEVLYDGRPLAEAQVKAAAANHAAAVKKLRELWASPPEPSATALLARRYVNPDLGHVEVIRTEGDLVFDFGSWKSHVASRKFADGSISFLPIDPGAANIPFVARQVAGKPELVLRDGQHEYVYGAAR